MTDTPQRSPEGTAELDATYAEQFPLAPIDDFMIHQTPDPIRVMWTSDPRTYERHWVVAHDDAGELMVVTGGSFYPSLNTAEAYAIVVYQGQHYSVRAFRPLGVDRMNMHMGPIKPTIVQGLRHWHFVLDPNDWGISWDLHWFDTKRQIFHQYNVPSGSGYPAGRASDLTAGFEGFGELEGSVTVKGKRINVTRANFRGTRDRHWGTGRSVGGPNLQFGKTSAPGWIGGNWVNFKDFAIWGKFVLYNFGDDKHKGMGKVIKAARRLKFDDDTRQFKEGIIDYTFQTGEKKQIHFKRLGFQTGYMKCGMYGGTPDKNIFHGMDVGEMVEGDHYDITKPDVRRALSGLNEHHCVITCDGETTTGVIQPVEPAAYELCKAGKSGWAFLD